MKVSIYSTAWNIIKHKFDYKDALDNWAVYADEISIAVGISEDGTFEALESYAKEKNYPVSLIRTYFDFSVDGRAYGKTENAALQNCTGDLLIQQNLDERLLVNKDKLSMLYNRLQEEPLYKAFFVPTIDLYGSFDKYLNIGRKWYIHGKGLFRGPVNFGIKEDGHPDYNKTSTDELIDKDGNLVATFNLINNLDIEMVESYVSRGMPIIYHLGFLSLKDRLDRSIWWKSFWEKATNGDKNSHPLTIEELANKESKKHDLPHWPVKV